MDNTMGSRCPISWSLFLGTAAYVISMKRKQLHSSSSSSSASSKSSSSKSGTTTTTTVASSSSSSSPVICEVVFVLGAPGTGKGTQCQLLQERLVSKDKDKQHEQHKQLLWTHLSAGDLLREERKSGGSELGELINSKISAGELVPSSITVKLLENAIVKANKETQCHKFLIDGFPRGQENMQAWESTMKHHTIKFVLNFECPEEVLVGRLLERGKDSGRVDDNMEVIRKRFKTHQENTVPIFTYFGKQNIPLHTIDSAKMVEHVYKSVEPLFL